MQNFNFLEKELLDIIFRGRNQQYGAYVLRKSYPQQVKNALLITGGLLVSLLTVYFASGGPSGGGIMPPNYAPDDPAIIIQRIVPKVDNAGKAGTVKKTDPIPNKRNPYEIVDDATPIVTPVQKDEKFTAPDIQIGTGVKTGPITTPGLGGVDPNGVGAPSIGGETGVTSKVIAAPIAPLVTAQIMPQFPGGEDALMEYLQSHMNYPKLAASTGVSGTVYVEFVVSSSGKIQDVKLLNSLGAGCDQEALRVIKSMPSWKPGIQDGHKVSVSFNIPVQFEL